MVAMDLSPQADPAGAAHDEPSRVIELAGRLLREAESLRTGESRAVRRRTARMAAIVGDRDAQAFTMALTDEVTRIQDPRRAARRFAALVHEVPLGGLGSFDRLLLRVGARLAPVLPRPVMALVERRLRAESAEVVLDADPERLTRHLAARRAAGVRSNVNVLGESILSDAEAQHRLHLVLEQLARPDVGYVSVKISAVCAHVSALAFDATVAQVSDAFRDLLRAAMAHTPAKFVNLDMEEYRDLELTTTVFRTVLDEPEFRNVEAGIVLQAYLPDSHAVAIDLCTWARARVTGGGAKIKIRVVKGANLAMETVEADLRGWELATFASKAEVDASYKALLERLLEPANDDSVRIGLASHNVFDLAWGLLQRDQLTERGQQDRLEFEMLEGMAPAHAAAVKARAGSILLYSPIVGHDDFPAAIAYLVRRLDENTAPENFLTALFEIAPGNAVFRDQANRFAVAWRDRRSIDRRTRRTQDRRQPPAPIDAATPFVNEADTDFTRPVNREWLATTLERWSSSPPPPVASLADVNDAVKSAVAAQVVWAAVPATERALLVNRIGDVVADRRGEILATMMHEAGKTVGEGDPEISEAIDFARYYARSVMAIERLAADGTASAPLGTVVVTPPWNFPFAIPLGGVVAALAAGNTVVLKPAPQAVRCASLVATCCWAAGVPHEVLQLVACPDDDAGRRLITHPDVDAVILTGAHATAQMFLGWRPTLRLHAETSGKNAMVITATADLDAALGDLVRSAFGHAGQKCSAASIAIVEASVYDDPGFRRRLRDAVTTLRVGQADDLTTDVGPLIGPPGDDLRRALTTLDDGDEWLVEPRCLDGDRLWSPGVRLGVRPGSWLARTECFGPVLAVMRAADLDEAIALQNDSAFGLTAGLQALDPAEIEQWCDQVEAGNLYVNRGVTGAIVQRQPFGGWKHSVVGPTVKAGGPHYVSSLRCWPTPPGPIPSDLAARFGAWTRAEAAAEHDPTGLRSERNSLRYRPLRGGVALRLGPDAPPGAELLARAAAAALGARLIVSDSDAESDDAFATRLASLTVDRLRIAGAVSDDVLRAAHRASVAVDDSPLHTDPRVELPRWLREQAVSQTLHRHGRLPAGQSNP